MMSTKTVLGVILLFMTLRSGTEALTEPPKTSDLQASEKNTLPILYNEVPPGTPMADIRGIGAQKYVILYSNMVPDQGEAGVINPSEVIQLLEKKISDTYSGWGVLDFEGEIFNRLFHGPINEKFKITSESLVKTIRALKRRWPNAKWTYWGMPDLKFWIHTHGEEPANWATANEEQKNKALDRAAKGFAAIAEEVDWISPWIYDLYRNENFNSINEKQSMIQAQRQWAIAKCQLTRKISDSRTRGPIPVIPMFCPMFAPGGNVATRTFVSPEEFRTDILEPVLAFGVDGLSTWSSLGFRVSNAFRKPVNQKQIEIRDNSRELLTGMLFKDDSFNWNSQNAERRVNDLIRSAVMDQLRMMRSALDKSSSHKSGSN